jgi:transposase
VIADTAYDADAFVQTIRDRGAILVIPSHPPRMTQRVYDVHRYQEHHLVECLISKLKQYRRIFSRFEKLASHYLGFLHFVGALIWLR